MYQKKVDPMGLSLEQNLVALPDFESLEETYTTLPGGYAPGFIAEVRSEGVAAVLLKNGSATLTEKQMIEGKQATIRDVNIPSAVSKGTSSIPITTSVTAASLFKDRFKNGYMYVFGGTGLKPNGSYRKLLLAGNDVGDGTGPINFHLAAPLPMDIDATTDIFVVSSVFMNTQQGAISRQKALGIPLISPGPYEYFWSIFEGQILGIAGEAIATTPTGVLLKKVADGELGLKNAEADIKDETVGKSVFTFAVADEDIILVDLFIQGIRQRTAN